VPPVAACSRIGGNDGRIYPHESDPSRFFCKCVEPELQWIKKTQTLDLIANDKSMKNFKNAYTPLKSI
jgi:hypothetical protein